MDIDIKRVAFSAPGSYLCVSDMTREVWKGRSDAVGLALRTVRGGLFERNGLLAYIVPTRGGREVPFTYKATTAGITIRSDGGAICVTTDACGQLRCAGQGLDMKLVMLAGTFDEFLRYDSDRWYIASPGPQSKLLFTILRGKAEITDEGLEDADKDKSILFTGDAWECGIAEFAGVYDEQASYATIGECVKHAEDAFEAYADAVCAGGPARFRDAMRQAAYVNYSSQVGPDGLLQGRVMLMSNNWMKSVWTWDCQFNAVETASYDPDAAWNNFACPFGLQTPGGMLPDLLSDRSFNDAYTKPPIHGWALSHLRRAGVLTGDRARQAYEWLLKWTRAWYRYMDWDHDGVCQYNHGNDSGWDNCTYFLCGAPIEGPDLSAYLVLCWDELAALAEELGMKGEAAAHRARGDEQLEKLLAHSWDGERFHVYQSGTHNEMTGCDSLLPFLPVILGKRLPEDVFRKLADGLRGEGRFLTPCGIATESVKSRFYLSDGYWRGPVWAPPVLFIVEGLMKGGEEELAEDIAERFCENCAREGFAENFDATTGKALRDRAYTWTSSVFLILAKHYVR